ncbi:Autophagy-related protein 27 [Cordyceps fumosorosea ARSEF 2679]|uniref:Autophagy-related protein 27 n=1 Tax=Cordyceps fumosorosea (strain ARSEF 2679) TaxID=1081104 RepID=A0A167LAL7_CORFA|nr:Autophagy-related protein 27 [Cordyceps fumosorosea ARSEF 2679]OAA52851.1 Autophagy-related protein 27 [Cordyceps fumosorosea ARSEF 2679]
MRSDVLVTALLGASSASAMLDCTKIVASEHTFDLSKLGGPHSVVTSRLEPITGLHHNRTYTLDVCGNLKKSGDAKKTEECPNGTRVCAIKRVIGDNSDQITEVIPIAGSLENHGGTAFDYDVTRLKTSDSNADSKKEGLRLVLKGGRHEKREQRAVIEFLCDRNRTGLEGEWEAEDKYESGSGAKRRRDDKEADDAKEGDDKKEKGDNDDTSNEEVEHQLKKEDASLLWESYGVEKDADILRLTWHTKYACEKRDDDDVKDPEEPPSSSSNWGFFTWLIIVGFLGTAAYLIFGSWLNYNRYGARGWDLLPHGDTIRDIPYLLKDWIRRVLNTVQGAGSRGGYSAV